jgi:hypothetical protein
MNNNRKNIIAGRALIAFSAILLVCCSYRKNSSKKSYQDTSHIKVLWSFPTLTANNKFIIFSDSLYIIYHSDLIIYKFPYTHEYTSNIFDSAGEIVEHKLIRVDTNFHYLVYRKAELYGYVFDSTQAQKGKKVLVDSLLKGRFLLVDKYIWNPNDSLIKKNSNPNNTIQETYIRKFKNDKWDCDTNHLFFSNQFKNIDFSLSRIVDSIKGTKLTKIHQISKGDSKNENFFFRQKREFLVEIKESPVKNTNEILSLIDRFYKMI